MLDIIFFIFGFLVVSFGFVTFFGAPYVPTLKKQVADIMKIHPLKKSDVFVDIGSGDGVVLRAAAMHGARAVGYELGPWQWLVSKVLSRGQENITIHFGNFWHKDLPSDTTVVYTFLNGRYMTKLEQKLQKHVNKHGKTISFITYGFKIEGRKVHKTEGPMFLYIFKPQLQT